MDGEREAGLCVSIREGVGHGELSVIGSRDKCGRRGNFKI